VTASLSHDLADAVRASLAALAAPLGLDVEVCAVRADRPAHPDDVALVADPARKSPAAGTIAGRAAARALLTARGVGGAVARRSDGAPLWPKGVVGSVAHDDEVAVCVIGNGARLLGVGVDVEPAAPLPAELVPVVCATVDERALVTVDGAVDLVRARAVFCAKEAVFKACAAVDGGFLDFADIVVRTDDAPWMWRAKTSTGRSLSVRARPAPRILVVCALLDEDSAGCAGSRGRVAAVDCGGAAGEREDVRAHLGHQRREI
jgi:4'-phosphopantetheinyl transferase EntD